MGELLNYKNELIRAMQFLAEVPNSIFIGQSILHKDVSSIFDTMIKVPKEKKIELPVFENTQMGLSLGLALNGFLPISIYPRMDFMLLAMDQLINHLDKFFNLSYGQFDPKVIIRTSVGATKPLYPGLQHCQNHSEMFEKGLTNVKVVQLKKADEIFPAYMEASKYSKSTILVEFAEEISYE